MRKTHLIPHQFRKRGGVKLLSLFALLAALLAWCLPITARATEQLPDGTPVYQDITYAHSEQREYGDVALTVYWDEPTLGQETHFHLVAPGASPQATVSMNAPRYFANGQDGSEGEDVADFSQATASNAKALNEGEADFAFTMAASGTYRFSFHVTDPAAETTNQDIEINIDVEDDSHPSVEQIVNTAVQQCEEAEAKTDYEKALWLHDWLLEKVQHDGSGEWTSAEAVLTRGTGTSAAYASAYSKLLNTAKIENAILQDSDGNAWNVVRLDDQWYHVDCFLDDPDDVDNAVTDDSDDTSSLDLHHLYFGLTDELIAKAHPSHAEQFENADYATPAASFECNYYVRHGEAQAWADSLAEQIQNHLDAREEEFSIDCVQFEGEDDAASEIINTVIANALENMQWSTDSDNCGLEVAATAEGFSIKASYEAIDTGIEAQSYGDEDDSLISALSSARLTRIYGQLRYNTMEALVNAGGWSKGGCAILASGTNYPDALAANALAGAKNAPILLTEPGSLSNEASSRLSALAPSTLYIVGGTSAVSQSVEQRVHQLLPNCKIVRVAGQTRIETSIKVAQEVRGSSATAIIATGNNYADALSVGPYAFKSKSPILLCDPASGLTAAALEELKTGGYKNAVIVGGIAAVPSSVESQLRTAGVSNIKRLAGSTRYETSAEIVRYELSAGLGFSMNGLLLATGENFPDALAAGPLAGKRTTPLLLVDSSGNAASSFLKSYSGKISYANVVGGPAAISNPTATKVAAAMGIDFETPTYYGFQNPSQYYQVSNVSVTIPHQGQGIFGYRTASKLSLNATKQDCINAMITTAWSYVGTTRYIWDYACAPGVGVDCAGLVMQCLYATGMNLGRYTPWDHYYTPGHNHYANDMWNDSRFKHVSFAERQVGDLVCYPGHIAIYVGNDKIIEAYSPAVGVRYGSVYIGTIRGCLRPFV